MPLPLTHIRNHGSATKFNLERFPWSVDSDGAKTRPRWGRMRLELDSEDAAPFPGEDPEYARRSSFDLARQPQGPQLGRGSHIAVALRLSSSLPADAASVASTSR